MFDFIKNEWSNVNWRAYITECIMLFLAVVAGFMTDSYLEYKQDREKERDFLRQMVEDLKMDTLNISSTSKIHDVFFGEARALSDLAYGEYKHLESQIRMYELTLVVLTKNLVVPFSKGSMNQIIYSGGLRTVLDPQIVNDITDYDSQLESIDQQREGMMIRNQALVDEARSLFYHKAWLNTLSFDNVNFDRNFVVSMYQQHGSALITEEREKIIQFANAVLVFSGYTSFYKNMCLKQKKGAEKLIREIEDYLKSM